jgi:hypothetical protein
VEEASNAMALDGIRFKEVYLKVRAAPLAAGVAVGLLLWRG